MALVEAFWVTPNGLRLTTETSLSVDLEVWADDVAGVTFTVVGTGFALSAFANVDAHRTRRPDYTDSSSPLPGRENATGLAQAPFLFGRDFPAAAFPPGTYEISAEIFMASGNVVLTERLVIYNDRLTLDSRPNNARFFVDPAGLDTNPGTEALPFLNIQHAINEAGILHPTGDVGGVEIVLLPGAHAWAQQTASGVGTFNSFYTSGENWLTITFRDGATTSRVGTQNPNGGITTVLGQHDLSVRGVAGEKVKIRLKLEGAAKIYGSGTLFDIRDADDAWIWLDGGRSGSSYWNELTPWSVRFYDDEDQPVAYVNPQASYKRRVSCHVREGCRNGFAGWTHIHETVITDVLGIGIQSTGVEDGNSGLNILIENQRYDEEVKGYFLANLTGVTITDLGGGNMRVQTSDLITFIGTGTDITFQQLAEILTSDVWGLRLVSGSNAGTYKVLSVGVDFCVLQNLGTIVPETGLAVLAETAKVLNDEPYAVAVHPDINQFQTPRAGCVFNSVGIRNFPDGQSWFTSSGNLDRCVFVNLTDGGHPLVFNFNNGDHTNCVFAHIGLAGPFDFSPNTNPHAGSRVISSVLTNGGYPSNMQWNDNHFIDTASSPAEGTGATTGPWFLNDTALTWDFEPTVKVPANDTYPVLHLSDVFYWAGEAQKTKGPLPQVAKTNWADGVVIENNDPIVIGLGNDPDSESIGDVIVGTPGRITVTSLVPVPNINLDLTDQVVAVIVGVVVQGGVGGGITLNAATGGATTAVVAQSQAIPPNIALAQPGAAQAATGGPVGSSPSITLLGPSFGSVQLGSVGVVVQGKTAPIDITLGAGVSATVELGIYAVGASPTITLNAQTGASVQLGSSPVVIASPMNAPGIVLDPAQFQEISANGIAHSNLPIPVIRLTVPHYGTVILGPEPTTGGTGLAFVLQDREYPWWQSGGLGNYKRKRTPYKR